MNRCRLIAGISAVLLALSILLPRAAWADGPVVRITQIDQSDFPRIKVFLSVTDAQGQPVRDMQGATFLVKENGQEVTADFEGGVSCINVALAIDRSGSMGGGKLEAAIRAANNFVELLQPCDRAAIIAFDDKVEVFQELTSDKNKLARKIRSISIRGGTAFYGAAEQGVELLMKISGRRAIVALTDGMDTASRQSKGGLIDLAQKRGVSIYTVGLGVAGGDIDEPSLKEVAGKSGGLYMHAPQPSELGRLYQAISQQIRSEYQVSFISPRPVQDGTRRDVELLLSMAGGQNGAVGTYLVGGVLPAIGVNWPTFLGILLPLLLLLWPGGLPALLEGKYRGQAGPTHQTAVSGPARIPAVITAGSPVDAVAVVAYPITKSPVTLGKDLENDVVLTDPSVDQTHAQLCFENQRYVLCAQHGRALVNFSGQPGQERPLTGKNAVKEGSRIFLGNVACTFKADPPSLLVDCPIPPGGLTIGKGNSNHVIVKGDTIAEQHATIAFEEGRWTVRSEGGPVYVSYSGNAAQERLVTGRNALKAGSTVRIGSVTLAFRL